MTVLGEIIARGHEEVSIFQDSALGLLAIVAIHDTTLGPALGGCRMNAYGSIDEALQDVLRLSEGMTYKNSLAGLDLGGGKAVILKDRALQEGRRDVFRTFGTWVNSFEGRYITAEDMGTSVSDMSVVLESCKFVSGRDPKLGGGGDPSPWTAYGVFLGMRACLERVYGSGEFSGRAVAVQGAGNVGRHLISHLVEAGAKVVVTDTRAPQLEAIRKDFGVEVVAPKEITSVACDVFAPCAIGGVVNPDTVRELRCRIVAGAANNQISGAGVEEELRRKNIVYAPDFAINAGGVILCADELADGGYREARVRERVERIYRTVKAILERAEATSQLTGDVAVQLAKERINSCKGC